MLGTLIAILVFVLIGGGLTLWGIRLLGRASQFVTMAIFSAAIVFGIAALAALTFLNIAGHT